MAEGQSEGESLVFVVDDDASVRHALTSLLHSVDLHVEEFGSAADFFREQDLLDAVQLALQRDRDRRARDVTFLQTRARFEALTSREQEVLSLVTAGLMNKQIAAELGVSEITVKVHRGNAMKKMDARSLADLVRMADALGVRHAKH